MPFRHRERPQRSRHSIQRLKRSNCRHSEAPSAAAKPKTEGKGDRIFHGRNNDAQADGKSGRKHGRQRIVG